MSRDEEQEGIKKISTGGCITSFLVCAVLSRPNLQRYLAVAS